MIIQSPSIYRTLIGLVGEEKGKESNFVVVFAAMGVNMETARLFKQELEEHGKYCRILINYCIDLRVDVECSDVH